MESQKRSFTLGLIIFFMSILVVSLFILIVYFLFVKMPFFLFDDIIIIETLLCMLLPTFDPKQYDRRIQEESLEDCPSSW